MLLEGFDFSKLPPHSTFLRDNTSIPDYEVIRSWASLFVFGDLTQIRSRMPTSELRNIAKHAARIQANCKAKRVAVHVPRIDHAALMAGLIVHQVDELIRSKTWASPPLRFINEAHLEMTEDEATKHEEDTK